MRQTLAPRDEKLWEYTLKTLPAVMEGKKVRGWTRVRIAALPRTAQEAKLVRRYVDVSQKEFAKILGVSLATVKAWESGARKPDGVATKVLRLLGQDKKMAVTFAKITL